MRIGLQNGDTSASNGVGDECDPLEKFRESLWLPPLTLTFTVTALKLPLAAS